jgi:hypothetical protein
MKRIVLAALSASSLVAAAGSADPQPYPGERHRPGPGSGLYADFDVRYARGPAEQLVLCDTTAFLASEPNLNADRMLVRREDRRPDLLLPPYFLGPGRWYKEGYQRLAWRLQRRQLATSDEIYRLQNTLGRRFIDAYRRANPYIGGTAELGFLRRQDGECRRWARSQGEIVDF